MSSRMDTQVALSTGDNETSNERSALLPKQSISCIANEVHNGEDDYPRRWRLVLGEFAVLLQGSIPVILAYTLQNSLQTVSVLIVGRLSPEALATAAFSYMFAMSTGWLIALGGTTAIDTLASASYTGSANKHDLGVILQRSFLVLGLLYIPVALLWQFSQPLFSALGQEDYIARDASRFLTMLIPGGLGYIYFEALKKYLQAQEIMRPGTYVLLVTSPMNACLNYLFVYTFGLGLLGAPIATGISYWLSFFLLLTYARFVSGWECWGGWTRQSYRNLWTFSRLALSGVIHVGTEWWAFEIVALLAGRLGTVPLAAQSVIMTADQVMNTIPFGVGVAASSRVGNLLGARDPKGAARSANTAAWLSMFLGALVLFVLMATKDSFARMFNNDEDVVKLTAKVIPYVAMFQIADGLNGSCGGALRGMGRQYIGAAVNIVAYYFGALPFGAYLALHGWGLEGLWIGQCLALYMVGCIEWAIVAWSDWKLEVEKALGRLDSADQAGTTETEAGSMA
ncbi:Putative transporter C11D3.06 [Hirsutella minnesotensis 3608]|uniref:Putative transporter C11D3.06 n=1 Tax=Hirsutella minnesotensis 3608 TaxID=1043627 RepID=A0A0F7ZSE8_9HYPO|nr:Putative transporter C11D3.06 [Hirsutella minnesotensis 3608]